MVILDLEWNRGYDNTPLDEILQIGAVRVEYLGGPVTDMFNAYIRPAVHKKFDPGAKQLPDLRMSQESELDFVTALEMFRAWCGAETEYAAWGNDDLATLTKNCEYWNIPALTMSTIHNFQIALSYLIGTTQQIALWRAVEYLNIPDAFTFHNALNDAMYTSMIGQWLTPESLEYKPVRRAVQVKHKVTLRLSKHSYARQPRQTIGPLTSVEKVLDSKYSRKPPCPICGRKGCVNQWRYMPLLDSNQPQEYFSVFSCPAHGRFLCRLTVMQLDNGAWRGRRTVPIIRPELIKAYTTACQGSVHNCKSNSKGRWHPRKAGIP